MSASPRRCSPPRSHRATATAAKAASRPRASRRAKRSFDFTFQRSVKKTVIEHLGQLDFLHGNENVALLGPPGRRSQCTFGFRE